MLMGVEILALGLINIAQLHGGLEPEQANWFGRLLAWIVMTLCAHTVARWSAGLPWWPWPAGLLARTGRCASRWVLVGIGLAVVFYLALIASRMGLAPAERADLSARMADFRGQFDSLSMGPLLALIIVYHLLAPVFEEITFRSILFAHLNARFGFAISSAISSVAFGLVHRSNFALMSVFGLGSCWLLQRSGRLAPSIALHASYNAMVTADALF